MLKENTSSRLKAIMKERNLRQVDILEKAAPLCKKHGVKLNKSDLSQYVSGTVEPGQDKLTILAKVLDVNEAWLMGYNVPMDKNYKPVKKININFNEDKIIEAIKTSMKYVNNESGSHDFNKIIFGISDKISTIIKDAISKDMKNIEESDVEVTDNKAEMSLLNNFRKLNDIGQHEASKRVEELTYIDKYKKEIPDYLQPVAAHLDGELTDEVKDFIDKF